MADRRPSIGAAEPVVDPLAYAEYRAFLLRGFWKSGLVDRAYSRLRKMLPDRFDRRLYTAITRRRLRLGRAGLGA